MQSRKYAMNALLIKVILDGSSCLKLGESRDLDRASSQKLLSLRIS
jgi:hypothetical protein